MSKVLVTGAGGFVGGYLCGELLSRGHDVIAVDNLSKYGKRLKSYSQNNQYIFHKVDAASYSTLKSLLADCDHFIAGAAVVGGVSFLQQNPYTMLRDNDQLTATAFDAAIWAHNNGNLKKITVISSSQVFEAAPEIILPVSEEDVRRIPPPRTPYALQKLAAEYYARAAWDQYKLPYTIVRPFNTVGVGDMDHVFPQLIRKVLNGQRPLHILGKGDQTRHFIHGSDLARGIVTAMEHPDANNEDFNISSDEYISIMELARMIWHKINGAMPFTVVCDLALTSDVKHQHTSTDKARRILGFKAHISLDEMVNESIAWMKEQSLEVSNAA